MINRFIPILQVMKWILLKVGITDCHFSLGYVTKGVKNELVWLYIRIIDKEKSEKCFPPSVFQWSPSDCIYFLAVPGVSASRQ